MDSRAIPFLELAWLHRLHGQPVFIEMGHGGGGADADDGVVDAFEPPRNGDDETSLVVGFHGQELAGFQHHGAEGGGFINGQRLRDDEVASRARLEQDQIEAGLRRIDSEGGADAIGQAAFREWTAPGGLQG